MTLDVARIRKDFPILDRTVRGGQPLIYLDSANTSQKPRQVIDALTEFYERHNANIHRATHELGEEATEAYEGARIKAARFIGAADETEVIFTKNISEGINLVAYSMGNASAGGSGPDRFRLGPGDEIVITEMEHHSNIVPWQLLCERTGATLRWFKVTGWDGQLDLSAIGDLINERTKLVALVHQSNVLGTINPVRRDRRRGPRGGRAGARGRGPVGAAHAGGRGRARRRLPRLHRPQDVRPDRHRRAVGTPGTARRDAAVPGWRGDDRDRLDGAVDLRAAAAQVRGGHHADRAGRRAWRRPSTTSARSGSALCTRTSSGCSATRCPHWRRSTGVRILGPADAGGPGRRDLVRGRRRAPARRQPGARRARHRRPGRAPLRLAAAPGARRPGQHQGLVLPVQHPGRGGRAGRGNTPGAAVLQVA